MPHDIVFTRNKAADEKYDILDATEVGSEIIS